MHRTESPLIAVAVCLAALAGFVDALAFTSLGGFFAAFMSGNATQLGVGLGSEIGGGALIAGALVMSFLSGVIVASVIVRASPTRHREGVMLATTALLLLAALAAGRVPAVAPLPLAVAMGAGHLLLARLAGGSWGLTAALVRAGERLTAALMGDADRWGWLAHLLPWVGFVAGAVLGAALHRQLGTAAWWIAPVASAVVTARLAMRGRHAARPVNIAR